MSVTSQTLFNTAYLQNSQAAIYSPNGARAILDRMTVTNNSASSATLSVWLVPNGGAAGGENRLIYQRQLISKESYSCPEIIGHVLESGDSVVTQASAGSALSCRLSGRVVE